MYIGIDIGGTKCAVVLSDGDGRIVRKERFATRGRDETLCAIFSAVERMGAAEAIGISCGGPLDSTRGVILSPPNLPGWDAVPIVAMLRERFGIPVYLQNDANACALAEYRHGAGRGSRSMVFFTFGTGLGAGLVLDGRLYAGACGNAGEAGHIRLSSDGPVGYGKHGSFEGFCSGRGLAQLGKIAAERALQEGRCPLFCPDASRLQNINAKDLADAAGKGDADALEVFCLCGRRLGEGLAIVIDLLNPDCIVLGSVYARCEGLLRDEMMRVLERECLPASLAACRILPAALGEELGDIAAVSVAMTGKEQDKI